MASILAAAVRIMLVADAGFPLNDGGMFASAIGAIHHNHFAPPETIPYNDLGIPFAYPPLGLYFGAALSSLAPIGPITALSVVALTFSIATIPLFGVLAANVLPSRRLAAFAVFAFAFIPRSFEWGIVGGGVTRAPGFAFALSAIAVASLLPRSASFRTFVAITAFIALAQWTHPEMGLFAAVSVIFVALHNGTPRPLLLRRLIPSMALGLAAILPWYAWVVAHSGIFPIISSAGTSGTNPLKVFLLLIPSVFGEYLLPILTFLALLGAWYEFARGRYWIATWGLALFVIDGRKAQTEATIPAALLVAVAVDLLLGYLPAGRFQNGLAGSLTRRAPYILVPFLWFMCLFGGRADLSPLKALTPGDRELFRWVNEQNFRRPATVVTGNDQWATDAASEWFPYLAGIQSVATVQGQEWTAGREFDAKVRLAKQLQTCATSGFECLEGLATEHPLPLTLVVVMKDQPLAFGQTRSPDCCAAIRLSLDNNAQYERVFTSDAGSVYIRR